MAVNAFPVPLMMAGLVVTAHATLRASARIKTVDVIVVVVSVLVSARTKLGDVETDPVNVLPVDFRTVPVITAVAAADNTLVKEWATVLVVVADVVASFPTERTNDPVRVDVAATVLPVDLMFAPDVVTDKVKVLNRAT